MCSSPEAQSWSSRAFCYNIDKESHWSLSGHSTNVTLTLRTITHPEWIYLCELFFPSILYTSLFAADHWITCSFASWSMQTALSPLICFTSLCRTRRHLTGHCILHSTQHNVLLLQSAQKGAIKWANKLKNERENENCGNMPKVTEQSETKAQLRLLAADLEATQCCSAQ